MKRVSNKESKEETIRKELLDILYIPTVLINNDRTPIEYSKFNRFRIKRRTINKVPVTLAYYVLKKGGSVENLEEFSSGDFERYLQMNNIFKF